ncbi:MAG: TRAP transporter substrate-binding protein [Sedimentisphaerales bacterium]|nr:TRAP transporter substrate-binding protein [Sedimentisphaerales bacterium]
MSKTLKGATRQLTLVTLVIIGVCILVGVLVAKVRAKHSDVIVLKLAHCLPKEHAVHKGMERMGELLKEKSGGTMVVEIFPNSQLGSERETVEQLQLGCIDVTKVSTATLENFVPAMKVFGMPYLFRDSKHFWDTLNSDLGKELARSGASVGLLGLCYYDSGSRSFYSKSKPILTPKDMVGEKVRVMNSPIAVSLIETLGGNAQTIPFGELYTALQQGVVDGAENNPPSLYTSKHYEVCKYYVQDEHTSIPDILIISKVVWDGLTPQQQQWVQEAANESVAFQREQWRLQTDQSMEIMKKAGVEVIYPPKEPFKEKLMPMYDKFRDIPIQLKSAKTLGELVELIRKVQ